MHKHNSNTYQLNHLCQTHQLNHLTYTSVRSLLATHVVATLHMVNLAVIYFHSSTTFS